jgi:hypothetical protein
MNRAPRDPLDVMLRYLIGESSKAALHDHQWQEMLVLGMYDQLETNKQKD